MTIAADELNARLVEVKSSNIAAIAYIARVGVSVVVFNAGTIWAYKTPRDVYDGLLGAESKGKYFIINIRGKYPESRLFYVPDSQLWTTGAKEEA